MKRICFVLTINIFILINVSCDRWERVESEYENYEEVRISGDLKRGWLPEDLPQEAYNIREIHYIDKESSLVMFSCLEDVIQKFQQDCKEIPSSSVASPDIDSDWWPDFLKGRPTFVNSEGKIYRCNGVDGFYAINGRDNKVYFWRVEGINKLRK